MRDGTPALSPRDKRRHRLAASLFFLTNGALLAGLLPRLPEVKDALDLSDAVYGAALAALPLGAFLAGPLAGAAVRRWGAAPVAGAGTALIAAAMLAAGWAPGLALFVAAMFLTGAADAIVDVGQNTHALRVQRHYGRSIISSMHAVWSLGAVLAWRATYGLPDDVAPGLAEDAAAGAVSAESVSAEASASDQASEPASGPRSRSARGVARPRLILLALALLTIGGAVGEDLANSWAVLYLSREVEAPAAVAAAGFAVVVGAQFVGRLLGDRQIDRWGARAVARAGGVVMAVGMGVALLAPAIPGAPTVALTLLGYAAVGYGVATLVPTAFHQADELPGLRPGTGVTVVAWLMRLGFLATPPLVGALSEVVGLQAALLVVPLAGVLVAVLASAVRGRSADDLPGQARAQG
ncbi:MAG: MFS transporter [Micrococcus sp.]|nr:MFS transporter [Micrococcus sp.]